jgi:serine/threonine protein kinase
MLARMNRPHPKPAKARGNGRLRALSSPFSDVLGPHDATRPDIVAAPLRFEDDEPSDTFDRYWDAELPAYTDWPEVRLAFQERRHHAPRAVLFHPAKRELGNTPRSSGAPSRDASLARRIVHPLVVPVLDLIELDGAPLLVMEYVAGVTLSSLERQWSPLRPAIAVAVVCDVLRALHAGHRATSSDGEPLGLVHGCLSPRDILIGTDGRARILDFALAEDMGRTLVERVERNRGYLAPEQVFDRHIDARTDVFTSAVVLWESLTGYALLAGDDPVERLLKLMTVGCDAPSRFNAEVTPELDAVILRALDRSPDVRFDNAADFASALASTLRPASASDVSERVLSVARTFLEKQESWRLRGSEAPRSETKSVLVARFGSDRPGASAARSAALDELTVPDHPPLRGGPFATEPDAFPPSLPAAHTEPTPPRAAWTEVPFSGPSWAEPAPSRARASTGPRLRAAVAAEPRAASVAHTPTPPVAGTRPTPHEPFASRAVRGDRPERARAVAEARPPSRSSAHLAAPLFALLVAAGVAAVLWFSHSPKPEPFVPFVAPDSGAPAFGKAQTARPATVVSALPSAGASAEGRVENDSNVATGGEDVPVLRVDDLPMSKEDLAASKDNAADSNKSVRPSKRRPSLRPRRQPAR